MFQSRFLLLLTIFIPFQIYTQPPADIPSEMWNAFTFNGTIPVSYWYFDDSTEETKTVSSSTLELLTQKARNREWSYNGELDSFIFQALDSIAEDIQGKDVCLLGSFFPWYESVLLSYGAHPVVLNFHRTSTLDSRVTYLTHNEFKKHPRKFDLILSISNSDHQGLGRFGEPLDPEGDLKQMAAFKTMLKPNGKLLLAVPIGPDALVWNSHRVYGWKRLKMLLKGWKAVKYFGVNREWIEKESGYHYEPVFLLTPR